MTYSDGLDELLDSLDVFRDIVKQYLRIIYSE